MMHKNPCYDTMTPAGQIVNRVALQDVKGEWPPPVPNTPHPIDEYDDWFRKYNALYGCPPISVATEAAYRAGWAAAIDNYERNKKEGW